MRDRLRDEARMLEQLAPLGVTPGKVHLFDEQGDLFLAEELVPGQPLNLWQSARARDGGPGADEAAAAHGVPEEENGLERFLTATRCQNFLTPPRRHRAFPLVEFL
ncbi:hypothetical protein ACFY04_40055 [Streptomyces sp. NPDC001549]|uniref:hypothetical protein n=1 Tax=Streptomyces sp. NPDC001549 TaxID=3364586 RepID=UPI0036837349